MIRIRSAFMPRWGLIKGTWRWCKGKKMLSLFGVSKTIWSGIWTGKIPGTLKTDNHKVIWHQTTHGMLTIHRRWGSDKFCRVLLSSISGTGPFSISSLTSVLTEPPGYQHLQDLLGENQRYANSPDVRHGYSVYFKSEAVSWIFKNHLWSLKTFNLKSLFPHESTWCINLMFPFSNNSVTHDCHVLHMRNFLFSSLLVWKVVPLIH